MQQFGHLCFTQ